MATRLEDFKAINEGAGTREALHKFAEELKSHEDEIEKALLADPELKALMAKDGTEAHAPQQHAPQHVEHKEAAPGEQKANEEMISSLLLSSPAILQGVGKGLAALGKKMGQEETEGLRKIGAWIDHKGHQWHEIILKMIKAILWVFIRKMPKDKQDTITQTVFYCILAYKVITGVTGLLKAAQHPEVVHIAAEAAFTGIKTGELITMLKTLLPALLKGSNAADVAGS